MKRRDFLKMTLAGVAAAGFPALTANPDWPWPDSMLGAVARGSIIDIQPTMLWVYPDDAELARRLLNGFQPAYTNLRDALDAAKPGNTICLLPGEHHI